MGTVTVQNASPVPATDAAAPRVAAPFEDAFRKRYGLAPPTEAPTQQTAQMGEPLQESDKSGRFSLLGPQSELQKGAIEDNFQEKETLRRGFGGGGGGGAQMAGGRGDREPVALPDNHKVSLGDEATLGNLFTKNRDSNGLVELSVAGSDNNWAMVVTNAAGFGGGRYGYYAGTDGQSRRAKAS